MKKILSSLMIFSLLFCYPSVAKAGSAANDFADINGHWAQQQIQACAELGLMSGTGTNQSGQKLFAPDSLVSHAQTAVVLQHTFQLDYGDKRFIRQPLATDYFGDVEKQSWYSGALVMCAINQVFDRKTHFDPAGPISRIELAQAIYRSFNAKKISIPMILMMPVFKDTQNLGQEETNAMVFVNNTGIMTGADNLFRPSDPVKRGELACILTRCIKLMSLDENADGQEIQLQPGQTFSLSLESNPTTGYTWMLSENYDHQVVSNISETYLSEADTNVVGQGGHQLFRFKTQQAGKTELDLTYARPWESVQPIKKFTLFLVVGDKNIKSAAHLISLNTVDSSDLLDIDLNIPQISGMADQARQEAINQSLAGTANELQKNLASEAAAQKRESQLNDFPFNKFQLYVRFSDYYCDASHLSFYVDYYTYSGGAHGATDRQAHTYDLATGQDLTLKDLFKTGYDYKSIINKEIRRQIDTRPEVFFSGEMGFNGISDTQKFYRQKNSLVVYFNQYEIAPYAAGIQEFPIDLSLLADGMK